MDSNCEGSHLVSEKITPVAPPLPAPATSSYHGSRVRGYCCVSTATKDLWERLFDEGYRADVFVNTVNGGIIYAHANILGMASPVMKGMLKNSKRRDRQRSISIRGVPHDAVRVFIRFLYSSCYEKEEMEEFVLHLLVLSHVFVVPQLKQECMRQLEQGLLTIENRQKERTRKSNERKIYLQLYEAMEALVHICRDGCQTIGPHDKDFKANQVPCKYAACKGLELLVRHFAGCKLRVPGGCVHCKRMWQLLELHSRLCANSDVCRVPLCRNFKEKIRRQSKKDEMKWRILAEKLLRTKTIAGEPFFSWALASST
ncbi:BTB/POZ and TAZ domain-containing protein 4-like isoform X2 [Corylus avellana]|uniref:BTB/POZ and TAZ domain-containing protein 4-like isoform X2 n=1 Tax=Corylus avellana TaxID=13451 RepID=UPI00286BCAEF|nr:BTB/POZ and TAZ domain-containing protein 4-like isoform X2 [Corylus avellana]